MKQSLLEQNPVVSDSSDVQEVPAAPRSPSYQPTQWAIVNQVLDIVDRITSGRAGLCQRFFMFAFIGGLAALVNIAVFYIVFDVIALPVNETIHNVIASVFAAEISIMANFIPNDFFTFRHLAGHQRSWIARCLRFHMTSIGGSLLTFIIEFSLSHMLHVRPIFAQAIALIIVLFYNFSFHHIFTYRHVKTAPSQA
ncbi:MAG TPA: GtrA family protein [Ktedonobacteraceae bacterium]|nr:GtrA family protein [Ktedonobacteraceae bacterium]